MPKMFVRINSDICTNITDGSLFVRKHNVLSIRQNRIPEYYLTLRLLMSYIYIYIYIYIEREREHLFLMFLDHTQRCTTVGRTPLDE